MALGFHIPEWQALWEALRTLVNDAGARGGAVVDASHDVWCAYGAEPFSGTLASTQGFFDREMTPDVAKQLRHGAKWSVVRVDAGYVAESFGGIYAAVIWVSDPTALVLARARLRRALPRIEALTLALPPPDGPDASSGAGKLRA